MDSKILLSLLAALMFALAGCTDGDDADGDAMEGGDDGSMEGGDDGAMEGGDDDAMEGGDDSTDDSSGDDEEVFETTYVNGTVMGVIDCQLMSGGGGDATIGGTTDSIPSGADGQSYTLEIVPAEAIPGSGESNPAATVCLYIDGALAANSGSVPDGASEFTVYADGAPEGVAFSLTVG